MLTLIAVVLAVDVTAPATSENAQEARFLGIGVKKEYGPCTFGTRTVTKTFTIFRIIRVGNPSYDTEQCGQTEQSYHIKPNYKDVGGKVNKT